VGEITNEIEREIRDKRENLGRNLDELEDKARELADWRSHYRNHTGAFLGVAFAAGAVVALSMVPSEGRATEFTEHDASHDPYRPRHASAPSMRNGNGTVARAIREANDTWGHIADALLRTASARVIELVSELVPGVRDHLDPRSESSDSVLH
jgi:hypothetical protein